MTKKLSQADIDEIAERLEHSNTDYFINRHEPLVREYPFATEVDLKYWEVIPGIEINLGIGEIGIKWLCFAMYYTWK